MDSIPSNNINVTTAILKTPLQKSRFFLQNNTIKQKDR